MNVNNRKLAIDTAFRMVAKSSFPIFDAVEKNFCFFLWAFAEIGEYSLDWNIALSNKTDGLPGCSLLRKLELSVKYWTYIYLYFCSLFSDLVGLL